MLPTTLVRSTGEIRCGLCAPLRARASFPETPAFLSTQRRLDCYYRAKMERHEALRGELAYAREQTDRLFRLISPGALYSRPVAERHRLIFYLGHFDAFDWNLLARRSLGAQSFHPSFDDLFERGIDPAPGQGPIDSPGDWPGEAEVLEYRAATRRWIDS